MKAKNNFDFLSSEIWIKYTQENYSTLEDIKYRLDSMGVPRNEWDDIKIQTQNHRKLASIPFYFKDLDKTFWFYPADTIQKKLKEIESRGTELFNKIKNNIKIKNDFLKNSKIEEAITSSIYEGANSSRAKAKELISLNIEAKTKDEYMLINNYKVMEWIKLNSNKNLTVELIKQIHSIVTEHTLTGVDKSFSGKFRNDKVFVSDHEGVDFKKIESSLDGAILLSTETKRYIHPLIKGILLHYFIAYIHPFFDGNGRCARTLFYFKCIKNSLDFVELLSVSASLKDRGKKYSNLFKEVKAHDNDLTYFIDFCLDSLIYALDKVEDKVCYIFNIANLKSEYQLKDTQIVLLQRLALNKFIKITSDSYAKDLSKTREFARQELKYLFSKKFLKEEKISKKLVYSVDSKYLKSKVFESKNFTSLVVRSKNDLKQKFLDIILEIEEACKAFDEGTLRKASVIAQQLRILLNDTKSSTSALTHIEKKNIKFIDSALLYSSSPSFSCFEIKCDFCNKLIQVFNVYMGLVKKTVDKVKNSDDVSFKFSPLFNWIIGKNFNTAPKKDFEVWWEQIIYKDHHKNDFQLSRKDLVLIMADKDGGAHIDAEIPEKYYQFCQNDSLRLNINNQIVEFENHPAGVSVIQIAYEVIESLKYAGIYRV